LDVSDQSKVLDHVLDSSVESSLFSKIDKLYPTEDDRTPFYIYETEPDMS